MGKFGDETALLVWMRYVRWPLIAVGLMVLGIVVGMVVAGIVGLFVGGAGGLVLGAIAGMMIGKDKKIFPVTIRKWVKYGGNAPKPPKDFVGRVNVRSFAQENAPPIEDIRIEYLEGTTLRRMSNFGPSMWRNEGGKPILEVMQIDRNTYLPLTWEGGTLTARNAPIYYSETVKDKDGNETIVYPCFKTAIRKDFVGREEVVFEKTEDGKLIQDPDGALLQIGTDNAIVLDTNKMKGLDGIVGEIPTGAMAKMNNDRAEFTQGWSIIAGLYNVKGFWDKYGHMLLSIICIAAIMLVVYWTYDGLNGNMRATTELQRQILGSISQQNLEVARLNAQMTAYWMKAGFNYNATFVMGPLVTNGTIGAPAATTPPLQIPFIS